MLRSAALLPLAFASAAVAAPKLSPADQAAAFKAAGYTLHGKQWKSCDDPGSASYVPGTIEQVADLNGDTLPEAVISESSSTCYGDPGTAFVLVSKQPGGAWKWMAGDIGMPQFLPSKGVGGWPDVEIGGPGFCFPVQRWNGREYARLRFEYDGKPCRP